MELIAIDKSVQHIERGVRDAEMEDIGIRTWRAMSRSSV